MDAHTDAVLARLEADANLTVYDGARKKTDPVREPPYVVVYVYVPREWRSKLNQSTTDRHQITISTHSAGADRPSADIVRRHVRTQLLDWVPGVAGFTCYRVNHEDGDAPDWDDTGGALLMSASDQWDYYCQPA